MLPGRQLEPKREFGPRWMDISLGNQMHRIRLMVVQERGELFVFIDELRELTRIGVRFAHIFMERWSDGEMRGRCLCIS